ncbi:hypothetical protein ATO6_03050 [Oceanicola sp. 22II-s10i]|uniref:MmgE/PrpD family protein n=1 Tax=Oceanicola sp. 22II-s10i TaxID=1317116 RepID=UPI000B523DF7|nr:MmgE/PrpD family protein [Oceanicola sp. 22II-s10i]OWU85882.1 hypothetical protein ATO6_03050 [Oceanicola sp. 22II-s10i]
MTSGTIAEQIGAWCNRTELGDISEPMLRRTKLHIMDQIGAQVSCRTMPTVELAFDYARRHARDGKALLVGTDAGVDAEYAGFANGTAGSAFEIDDYGGNGAYSHPGCTVLPAVLAMAQEHGASGEDLLRGTALGFETIIRLARATMPSMFLGRGFHHTSALGAIGAAVGCGALLRLPPEVTANAISIAASQSAGTTEYAQSGGEVKRCHAGLAVAAAIRAVRLAQAGLTAPPTILEGSRGFFQAYCDTYDAAQMTNELGTRWFFLEHAAIKPYAACGLFHHHFAAYDDLLARHGFAPSDIESIELGCEPLMMIHNGAHGPAPKDIVGAQFSSQFSMGMHIVLGRNDVGAYLDQQAEGFANPEVIGIARRITTHERPEFGEFPPRGSVAITLRDGTTVEATGFALGSPENPLSEDDIRGKYLQLVSRDYGEDLAERSMDMMLSLELLPDAGELLRQFA